MTEWQPIETAPKDETRILMYRTGYAESTAVGAYWPTWEQWVSVPGSYTWKPTHWMPLPKPPSEDTA